MTLEELKKIDGIIQYVLRTAKTDGLYRPARDASRIIEREIKLKIAEQTPSTTVIEIKRDKGGRCLN